MINHIIQVSKEEKTKISTKELKCTKFEVKKMIMIAFMIYLVQKMKIKE